MAQRWMEAKMILAKRHGTLRSGCNRATGACWDDMVSRRGKFDDETRGCYPITNKLPRTHRLSAEDRPVAWGKGRRARRADMAHKR